jgi:predicted nucleic acid-binding protein
VGERGHVTISMPSVSTGSIGNAVAFVDTNVLVYAHDASEKIKQPIAQAVLEELWSSAGGVLSTQVLQEFYVVATSKLEPPMSPSQAREIVSLYSTWPVVLIEPSLILTASRLHEQDRLSFWDALIVEAARVMGAGRLLSEDLADGASYAGVRVENPFRPPASRPR